MSAENVINLFSTGEIPRSKLFETLRQLGRENAELKTRVDELERKEYKLKKDNIESLDLLAADTELQNRLADQIESKDKEMAELRKLVEQMRGALSILGRIWFYGDFKPETPNEKHLSVMMKEMGFKYESENEVLAALEAAERGGE